MSCHKDLYQLFTFKYCLSKKEAKTKQKNINFIGLKLFKPTEDLNNNQYVIVREKQILLSVLNLYGYGRLLQLIDN